MSEAEIRRVLEIAAELSSSCEEYSDLGQTQTKRTSRRFDPTPRPPELARDSFDSDMLGFHLSDVSLLSSARDQRRGDRIERSTPRRRPALVASNAMCGPPPQPAHTKSRRGMILSLFACVILPTVALGGYYYAFAADQYVSEFRFSISQGLPVLPATPANQTAEVGSAPPGAASPSVTAGLPQTFIVSDYLASRQAVEDLQSRISVKAKYAADHLGWWEGFDLRQPDEAFFDYFRKYVHSNYDSVSGIAVASVRAYRAADAFLIAKTMSTLAEKLVDALNTQSYAQAIRFAEAEVERAEKGLADINARLLAYRTAQAAVDPQGSASANSIALSQSLQASLANLLTRLNAQPALDPDSPSAKSYMAQIGAAKDELARIESQIAGDGPPSPDRAAMIGHYENLIFDQQTSQNIVLQARQALETARVNAAAQHLYIAPYVLPALPTSSTYPDRPVNTLLGGMILFSLWLTGTLIWRSLGD